jgi:general secretion pathway protein G
MHKRKKTGFTLIELLVVATIIVVLSAIGLVSFANAGKGARNSKRKSDLETVRQALVLYKSDTTGYPVGSNYEDMIGVLSAGYLSSPTPIDPKDGQSSCGISGISVCGYTYSGDATTFILTAPLEGDQEYLLTNP